MAGTIDTALIRGVSLNRSVFSQYVFTLDRYTYLLICAHAMVCFYMHWFIKCIQLFANCILADTTPTETSPTTPPPPTALADNALIGVSVALAALMASVVGACVPIIVCIYFRNRHSKKRIAER